MQYGCLCSLSVLLGLNLKVLCRCGEEMRCVVPKWTFDGVSQFENVLAASDAIALAF